MKITQESRDGAEILHVEGKIDTTTAPELEREVNHRARVGEGALILDLAQVDYVSSAGLRVLLLGVKALAGTGRAFIVLNPSDDVMDVIQLTGFQRILKICDTLDAAMEAAKAA